MMEGSAMGKVTGNQTTDGTNFSTAATKYGQDDDNESDWEYEYSATETETFYVTLDLSKEDFKGRDPSSNNFSSRGGWPVFKGSEQLLNRTKHTSSNHNGEYTSNDNSDGDFDSPGKQPSDDEDVNLERVQILDLHSESPLISYKGRLFEGQWYETLTTEFIMMHREDKSGLPVLRHLDDSVDLLAAGCARINVTEKKLKHKDSEKGILPDHTNTPANVLPLVEANATIERVNQRSFLANLMAIKKRKGEKDDVTVFARTPYHVRPSQPPTRGPHTGRRVARHTYRRLNGGSGVNRRRSRRSRGNRRDVLRLEEGLARTIRAEEGEVAAENGEQGVSLPTPAHWDDLVDDDATAAEDGEYGEYEEAEEGGEMFDQDEIMDEDGFEAEDGEEDEEEDGESGMSVDEEDVCDEEDYDDEMDED